MVRKTSATERADVAQLLIDILKWDIDNAGEMSGLRRAVVRRFAKADSLYGAPVPNELL